MKIMKRFIFVLSMPVLAIIFLIMFIFFGEGKALNTVADISEWMDHEE